MSKPRYDWWSYVRGILRRYPHRTNANETRAVMAAIEETEKKLDGKDRLKIIELVYFKKTKSLIGAAMVVPCSERTAQRYHADFIRLVAEKFECSGLF